MIKPNKVRIGLGLAVLFTRIPFVAKYLYSWDAVQFSLAFQKFDLAQHQPHPPGYLLYVWLGKLAFYVFRDENAAFVTLSVLASIAAAICFYEICRLLFKNKNLAIAAAFVFALNPVFWYYGEVASTYIFDCLFATLFALLTLLIFRDKNPKRLVWFAAALGISGGFRESLVVLFAPLFLLAAIFLLLNKRLTWRAALSAALAGLAATALWLVPLLWLAGGLKAYREVTASQLGAVAAATSILDGAAWIAARRQLVEVAKVSLAIFCAVPLAWLLFFRKGAWESSVKFKWLLLLGLVWFSPSYFVYVFVHFGNVGYLMTAASGLILFWLLPLARYDEKPHRLACWFLILIAAAEAAVFLFLPQVGGVQSQKLQSLLKRVEAADYRIFLFSRTGLKAADFELDEYLRAAREFDPETTLILTEAGFRYRLDGTETWVDNTTSWFRQMEWYLPEFTHFEITAGENHQSFETRRRAPLVSRKSAVLAIPKNISQVIIFTDGIDRDERALVEIQRRGLPSRRYFYRLDLGAKNEFTYQGYRFVKS